MKKALNIFLFLLAIMIGGKSFAQDKIVFRNGKKTHCKIMAINPHTVTYKDSANGDNLVTISKKEVLMAEYKSGSVYIFGDEEQPKPIGTSSLSSAPSLKSQGWKDKESGFSNNLLGIQLPDLLFGRVTLAYERLFLDKMLGIAIPVSLSYDTRVLMPSKDSNIRRNVSYIVGLDANLYFDTRNRTKFFVGPRFRYGTDVFMGNITATSVQFQTGFFFSGANGITASTLSLGFGFARIIAVAGGGGINPKQSYPWLSFTYRLSFRLQKPKA